MPHSTSSYKSTADALATNWGMPAQYQYNGESISTTLARMRGLKFDEFGAISYETPGRPGVITVEPAFDHPSRRDDAARVPTYLGLKVDELDMLDDNRSAYTRGSFSSKTSAKSIRYAPGTILNSVPRNPDFKRSDSPYPGSAYRFSPRGSDIAFSAEAAAYRNDVHGRAHYAASSVYSRPQNSVGSAPHYASSKTSHSAAGSACPRVATIAPSLASRTSKKSVREPDHSHLEVPPFRPLSPAASWKSVSSHLERERARESALIKLCGGFKPTAPIPRSEPGSTRSYVSKPRSVMSGPTESIQRSHIPAAIPEESSDEEGVVYQARSKRVIAKTNGGPRPTLFAVRSRRTGQVRYERRYGYSSSGSVST